MSRRGDFLRLWVQQNAAPAGPPDDEIWYWAPEKVTLYTSTDVVSHEFADGKGVLKFTSPVTKVGKHLRGTAVTNVALPACVTSIGAQAFYVCSELAMTRLPDGVTSIGNNAFIGCGSLALTSLPAGVTSVAAYAFSGCWDSGSNHTLTFLGTPSLIDDFAFISNSKLYLRVPWSEGVVAGAPWRLNASHITYDYHA